MTHTDVLPHRRAGQGSCLVLVHGYLGGSAQRDAEIAQFSDRFDVIAPDLPGYGDAADAPGCARIADMADAVFGLLEHLGVDRFILLGHSMGGMIEQQIAAQAGPRVEKLILYGTGPLGWMPDRFEPIKLSRERLGRDGVEVTISRIGATWFRNGETAAGFPLVAEIGASGVRQQIR